jgi:hypothetical protein
LTVERRLDEPQTPRRTSTRAEEEEEEVTASAVRGAVARVRVPHPDQSMPSSPVSPPTSGGAMR